MNKFIFFAVTKRNNHLNDVWIVAKQTLNKEIASAIKQKTNFLDFINKLFEK